MGGSFFLATPCKTDPSVIKLIDNCREITETDNIANTFNEYFSKLGDDLASQIPEGQTSPFSYLSNHFLNSFFISPVTAGEIEIEIANLNLSKSVGPFSIPLYVLKLLKGALSKPLEILFNASFTTGIVPNKFKIANIIPVYKNGSRNIKSNYRPISLLSVFNKLLEKLMSKRLISYIDSNNIFSETQFGFRSNHSTDHAILSIVDKIQKAIDERYISCGIFLDLSKAFDTVNHSILIGKLEYYGIRGVAKDWFVSYLSERQQTVKINNIMSDPLNVHCGVPQGSVLGPILFLLYINDFHKSSNLFSFHIFADDANLFYRHRSIDTLQININEELPKIHTWLCANRLLLNIEKTSFVIFHPPQKKNYISNLYDN